jgi:hypothetical protein
LLQVARPQHRRVVGDRVATPRLCRRSKRSAPSAEPTSSPLIDAAFKPLSCSWSAWADLTPLYHRRRATIHIRYGTRSRARPPTIPLEIPSRIPPHNLDAERAILGAILIEDAIATVAPALRLEDLYTDRHRSIYAAMLALHDRDEPIDLITLSEELRRSDRMEAIGGPAALALLVEQASIAAHLPSYLRIVRDMAVLRELIQTSTHIITTAYDAKDDPSAVITEASERLVTLERRLAVVRDPLPVHTWAELVARKPEKLVYAWPGWVVEKKIVLVAGAGDSMKSFLCTFLAAMVAAGRPALEPDNNDNPCAQGPALIVSAENGYDEDTRRVQLLHRGHALPDQLPVSVLTADSLSLRDAATWASFADLVATMKPRLIVIDSGISVADLDNENDNAAVASFMKKCIQPLARVHGATVLLIVHSPKPPTQRGSLPFTDEHVARGASAWRNAADGVLYLKRDKSLGKDAVVLRPAKVRAGFRHPPIWFRIETTEVDDDGQALAVQVRYGGEFTEETGQAADAAAALGKAVPVAIQVLKTTPGSRISKLTEAMVAAGITEATARRAIAVLRGQKAWPSGPWQGKKQAVVDETPGGRKSVFLTFNPSMEAAVNPAAADDDDAPF